MVFINPVARKLYLYFNATCVAAQTATKARLVTYVDKCLSQGQTGEISQFHVTIFFAFFSRFLLYDDKDLDTMLVHA
jgi:hypothetical protein